MIRVYLDNCCLQRHLDDQTQPRIKVETEALFAVLAMVRANELVLLNSEALNLEISRIRDAARRMESLAILSLASENLQINDDVQDLARRFQQQGLQPMDAIHLALASVAQADYFCTCDDKLLRKAQVLSDLGCKVTNLLNLIMEITK